MYLGKREIANIEEYEERLKDTMNGQSSVIIYTTEDGSTNLQMKMENETVWLTQSQMAELFGRDRTVIARHINNCFKEGELDQNITCAKFAQVQIGIHIIYRW